MYLWIEKVFHYRRSSPLMPRFFKYLMTVLPVFFQLESAPFRCRALVLSLDLITITPRSVVPSCVTEVYTEQRQ
jgi:hypothetical protein